MAHYAKVNNSIVEKVIVADAEFFNTFTDDSSGTWMQSSTANVGFSYDAARDAYIPPKPYPSYILNESTNIWKPPVAHPADGKSYDWDEATTNWVEIE
jgi:hypothetical protein